MSRGPGTMQEWIVTTLYMYGTPMSTTALHAELMDERDGERKRRGVKDCARSARNSLSRALRQLEAAGTIRRKLDQWETTAPDPAEIEYEKERERERTITAYHEAGHAVISLATGVPLALATAVPKGRSAGHVTWAKDQTNAVGAVYARRTYKKRGGWSPAIKVADLSDVDAFGNKVCPSQISEAEHHGHIKTSIAGPMTDAIHCSADPMTWRKRASYSDMYGVRWHRNKLGAKAKSAAEYAADTLALVRKYWPMIAAVAARLLKAEFLSGHDIDAICRRVVRGQHLKKIAA